MSILIKQVQHNGEICDVLIENNRIKKIDAQIDFDAEQIIDASNKAILPTFHNMHTHAGMSLMRGYADDIELHTWLTEYIWPLEAHLTDDLIYHGTKLACLEMIKTGTTFFNDMYWRFNSCAKAVEEMGIRAVLTDAMIDLGDKQKSEENKKLSLNLFEDVKKYSDRIQFALGPHAIYTVSKDSLIWISKLAKEHDVKIHLHLSETQKEVDDCIAENGMRPVEYLDSIGFLSPNLIIAHAVWLSEKDMQILSERGVAVAHNPCSNMKISSGIFDWAEVEKHGILITIGTDGNCSNNNLDMLEEMKFAALLAKIKSMDPTTCPARSVFDAATINGAKAFGLESGKIEKGALADCMLIDLNNHKLVPGYNLISDLVYSADSACIDTVICDGKILMQNHKVEGEEKIIADARIARDKLIASSKKS